MKIVGIRNEPVVQAIHQMVRDEIGEHVDLSDITLMLGKSIIELHDLTVEVYDKEQS